MNCLTFYDGPEAVREVHFEGCLYDLIKSPKGDDVVCWSDDSLFVVGSNAEVKAEIEFAQRIKKVKVIQSLLAVATDTKVILFEFPEE